ncbi:MAG: hypothetical protein HY858_06070 [Candidatus Solibacter usitatus]|nr:hypothetical protein [Candidatus Solibacter usitatus]
MELRVKETAIFLMAILAPAGLRAAGFEYPARHDHWRGGCAGMLRFSPEGVSFSQIGGKKTKHQLQWSYDDIQQLELTDGRLIRLLSYKDRPALAGKDRPFDFTLDGKPDLMPLYKALSGNLDQRFVARLGDLSGTPEWRVPVKRVRAIRGSEGVLAVFPERIVYKTAVTGESRTWRDADIRNVSSSGPFDFALDSLEKDGTFSFQLKQALDPARYEALWRRLNRPRGLSLISTTKENPQ